jgi:hypothetical protein
MKCYRLLNLPKENNANPLPYIILRSVKCIATTAMSNPGGGDSRSLLLDSDRKALGLFFSHTPTVDFFNHLEKVLTDPSINVDLVTSQNWP